MNDPRALRQPMAEYEERHAPVWNDDLAVERAQPMSFSADDIQRIEQLLGNDKRRRWTSFGTWRERPSRLVLFRMGPDGVRFTVTRFADGTFELANGEGRVLRRRASMAQIIEEVGKA